MAAQAHPTLCRVVPNELWQLILEFEAQDFRLFEAKVAREEFGWVELAYPQKLKGLAYTAEHVRWSNGNALPALYLYTHSRPIGAAELEAQILRVAYKNQAPTPEHPLHHVYGVYIAAFAPKPFVLGQSIGGGHGDSGGSESFSHAELVKLPNWQHHFELSGCAWAVPIVAGERCSEREVLNELVAEVCRREAEL